MKKILLIFAVLSIAFSQSCKKNSTQTKPAIADIPLDAQDMNMAGDSSVTALPYPAVLILNADYSWTLDVQGAKSFGTYTWVPTIAYKAQIYFTITHWTQFGTDPAKSNKLKNILLAVEKCELPGSTFYGVSFNTQNINTFIRAVKK